MRGIRPALDPRRFRNLPVLSRSWPKSEIGFGIRPAAAQSPKWLSGFVPQPVKVRNGFRDLSRSWSKSEMGSEICPAAGRNPKWASGFVPQLVKVRSGLRDVVSLMVKHGNSLRVPVPLQGKAGK